MRNDTVPVTNVRTLFQAYKQVEESPMGLPRVMLVFSYPGLGKSYANALLNQKKGGYLVTASDAWSPNTMLKTICKEMGHEEVKGTKQDRLELITQICSMSGSPIFVDESDKLLRSKGEMLELLRFVHDVAGVPLVLIGEEKFSRRITQIGRLDSRIARRVEFKPLSLEDAQLVAQRNCDVPFEAALIEDLHDQSKGSIRRICVGLARLEAHAKVSGLNSLGLDRWKDTGKGYFAD
jgi:DNA transposition AAA+ family ATPase